MVRIPSVLQRRRGYRRVLRHTGLVPEPDKYGDSEFERPVPHDGERVYDLRLIHKDYQSLDGDLTIDRPIVVPRTITLLAGSPRLVSSASGLTAPSTPWLQPKPVLLPCVPGHKPNVRSDESQASRAGFCADRSLPPVRPRRSDSAGSIVQDAPPPLASQTCLSYTPGRPKRSCVPGPARTVARG